MRKQTFTFSFHSRGEGKMLSGLEQHMLKQSEFSVMSSIDILTVSQGFLHNSSYLHKPCLKIVKMEKKHNIDKINVKNTRFGINWNSFEINKILFASM